VSAKHRHRGRQKHWGPSARETDTVATRPQVLRAPFRWHGAAGIVRTVKALESSQPESAKCVTDCWSALATAKQPASALRENRALPNRLWPSVSALRRPTKSARPAQPRAFVQRSIGRRPRMRNGTPPPRFTSRLTNRRWISASFEPTDSFEVAEPAPSRILERSSSFVAGHSQLARWANGPLSLESAAGFAQRGDHTERASRWNERFGSVQVPRPRLWRPRSTTTEQAGICCRA
jgi:hypothetical protein